MQHKTSWRRATQSLQPKAHLPLIRPGDVVKLLSLRHQGETGQVEDVHGGFDRQLRTGEDILLRIQSFDKKGSMPGTLYTLQPAILQPHTAEDLELPYIGDYIRTKQGEEGIILGLTYQQGRTLYEILTEQGRNAVTQFEQRTQDHAKELMEEWYGSMLFVKGRKEALRQENPRIRGNALERLLERKIYAEALQQAQEGRTSGYQQEVMNNSVQIEETEIEEVRKLPENKLWSIDTIPQVIN